MRHQFQPARGIVAGFIPVTFLLNSSAVEACPACRPLVKASVYDQHFAGNLFLMLLPVAVLIGIGVALYFIDRWPKRAHAEASRGQAVPESAADAG